MHEPFCCLIKHSHGKNAFDPGFYLKGPFLLYSSIQSDIMVNSSTGIHGDNPMDRTSPSYASYNHKEEDNEGRSHSR